MNEYGDSEPTEPTRPQSAAAGPEAFEQPTTAIPTSAPSWHWTGTPMASHQPPVFGGGQPGFGGWAFPPVQQVAAPPPGRSSTPLRVKLLGAAAALVLVGGAAAGGAAFAYAHTRDSSSAAGIAGGSGSTSQGATGTPGEQPGQSEQQPPQNGHHSGQRHRGDGSASRFSTPGHASAAQSVGVVDIDTKLKFEGARAAGTGMILTSTGEILTNNHVVEGATTIKVTVVSTGKKYSANVVGTDKVDDVAVLQLVGASGLQTVTTDTGTTQVGDAVTAVGNAMGAGGVPSAAEGTITGLSRSITTQSEGGVAGERLTGLIEVNAMVVSGDSGGPLLDSDGHVIGMDTAASSSPAQSTGFAIPIAKALAIADQMESGDEGGNITLGLPAFLGVQFSLNPFGQDGSGAVVGGVLHNTPADNAGIFEGDIIKNVGGTAITSGDQLRTVLSHYQPGQSVSVTWTDSRGGSHTATVKLIAGPAE